MNKITPETRAKFSTMAAKRREEALINEANCMPPPPTINQSSVFANRKRCQWTLSILHSILQSIYLLSIKLILEKTKHTFPFYSKDRFRNVAENAILYVGSQHGKLDQISLVLFPLSFLLFASIYWIIYLNESNRRNV